MSADVAYCLTLRAGAVSTMTASAPRAVQSGW